MEKPKLQEPYQTPHLEQQENYALMTGLSVTFDFLEPSEPLLENNDFLGGTEQ